MRIHGAPEATRWSRLWRAAGSAAAVAAVTGGLLVGSAARADELAPMGGAGQVVGTPAPGSPSSQSGITVRSDGTIDMQLGNGISVRSDGTSGVDVGGGVTVRSDDSVDTNVGGVTLDSNGGVTFNYGPGEKP